MRARGEPHFQACLLGSTPNAAKRPRGSRGAVMWFLLRWRSGWASFWCCCRAAARSRCRRRRSAPAKRSRPRRRPCPTCSSSASGSAKPARSARRPPSRSASARRPARRCSTNSCSEQFGSDRDRPARQTTGSVPLPVAEALAAHTAARPISRRPGAARSRRERAATSGRRKPIPAVTRDSSCAAGS